MSEETKQRRIRGAGSVFRKKGWKKSANGRRVKDSSTWTIQYYRTDPATGKNVRVREGGFETRAKAQHRLTEQLSAVNRGEWIDQGRKAVTVADLFADLKTEVENNAKGPRSVAELEWRWNHLKPVFAYTIAANLTTAALRDYIRKRQKEGASNGCVNRELGKLRRAVNLGKQSTPPKVRNTPYFPMLKEARPRQGFVEQEQFDLLVDRAEELWPEELWLLCWLELAYLYGWRKGELLSLRVEQVNFFNRAIRLSDSKNGEGREVKFSAGSRVEKLLRKAVAGKKPKDYVLTRDGQPANRPVGQFPGTWATLCISAGLGKWVCKKCEETLTTKTHKGECGGKRKWHGLIPHDLRRSAAKAARLAGVSESVVMNMGGWRTASMFRRYAIGSSRDQQQAVELIEAARARERERIDAENVKPLLAPTHAT